MSDLVKREQLGVPVVLEPSPQDVWIDAYLDEKQSDIDRYAGLIVKRKWLVLAVTLVVIAATAAWTFTTKPRYKSSVKIQIEPEQRVLPYRGIYESVTADPLYLGTQAQVLESEMLARRIVTRLNLTSNPDKVAGLANWFRGNLVVRPIPATQVVSVSYANEDPSFAAKAVNTLADEYVSYSLETKQDATAQGKDFLQNELLKQRRKLERSEEQLVRYSREHGIFLPSEKDNVVLEKLQDLNKEINRVEDQILANQHLALRDTTPESFPESLKTAVMRDLDVRRAALEAKLATLTLQFGPKWPEVIALNQELAHVHQQLDNERKKAFEQAKTDYNLAVAHRRRLADALAAQNRLADQLSQDSIQFNILKREVESDRQLHDGLLQRLKETDVSSGLKSVNVHVIDRGQVPRQPDSPNLPRNLALGLTLGLFSGIMCALGVAFLDRTVKTPEDVERELRLPLLGAIPAFDKSWRAATGGILVQPRGQPAHRELAPYVHSTVDVYWETYRALRTSLLFCSSETRPKTILVTSALAQEGKTTSAVNLAIVLAQTGARTLLVELDMRRPKLADLFQVPRTHGMSRYLSGQCELSTEIHRTGIPNLTFIAAGPVPPNPPELVGSARLNSAFQLLGRYFDHIIVDSPPLMPVTDTLILSRQVDGVVLVVRKTPKSAVQKARRMLSSVDAKLLGVLINDAAIDAAEIGYYPATYARADDASPDRPHSSSLHLN